MKAFNETSGTKPNVEKPEIEKTKKPEIGYSSFREQPGYAEDYKDGFNKYDAMLKYQEDIEANLQDGAVVDAHEKIKQAVKAKKGDNLLGAVRDIASSKAFRAAFLSVMLFAKVGQASAENLSAEKMPNDKIEMAKDNSAKENSQEGNYVAGFAEFLRIKASNYFETDKAEIGAEEAAEIQANFKEFLDGVNNENFQDIVSKKWVIRSSSDERATKNWGGSNENLSKARAEALYKVIKESLSGHKYSKEQRLSEEQKLQLIAKKIEVEYPQNEDGKENGVTYITDKLNPETGENYTDAEVAQIKKDNPEEYQKLLESCRFTKFETESDFFADAENFDQVHFLIDESGSMAGSKAFISNHLRSVEMDKKINLHLYSDQVNNEETKCFNSEEAADKILKLSTEGSFRERQVNSALGLINKIAAEQEKDGKASKEKHKVYIATDEAIQRTNSAVLEILQSKAEMVGADVEFLIGYTKWVGDQSNGYRKNEVFKLSLNDLVKKVEAIKEVELAKGINKDIASEKADAFYKRNYESKKAEFSAYLANPRHANFKNFLTEKGYGSDEKEVAENLSQELSGPKNYSKLADIINLANLQQEYNLKNMGKGRGDDAKIAESAFSLSDALRSMVEAKNEMNLVLEATKNLPSDKIPDIKSSILINVIDDVAPVKLPVNGPEGMLADLTY